MVKFTDKIDKDVAKRTLYYYFEEIKKQKVSFIIAIITTPIITIVRSVAVPYVLADMVQVISDGGDHIADRLAPKAIAFIILYALSSFVLEKIRLAVIWRSELNGIYDLSKKCFDAVSAQSMQFHNDRFSGSLVSQVTKFTGSYEFMLDILYFNILPMFTTIISIMIVLFNRTPLFAIILLAFTIVYTLIAWKTNHKIMKLSENEAKAKIAETGQLSDSISNIMSVKSYANEAFEGRRFAKFAKESKAAGNAYLWGTIRRDISFSLVNVGIIAVTLFFVAHGVDLGLEVSTIILILTYSNEMMSWFWNIQGVFKSINRVFGDAHEMTETLDTVDDVTDRPNAKKLEVASGAIDFDHIWFAHKDARHSIFEDFSLDIKPGERVGLVGVSGSGKTTLTKLLLRFADVNAGEITIDGQNISDVTQHSLRKAIAYVPQETALFHRSVAENIAYGKPDASMDEIVRAARLANADEFIVTLKDGYNTLVGERGIKLSGGQRQRIAIARAILKDAPILVLDEATSALDSESEALIQEALDRLMKGRTSIVVAHRLSTIASMDRIVVLENGRIAEQGTHAELLSRGGPYKHLWSRQSGAFLNKEND